MSVGDVTIIPNVGFIIVGGNPQITKYDLSRLCKKGENIIVKNERQELTFKVLDINLSYSISEKVIIGIRLEESDNLKKIQIGDKVYKNS